MKSLLEQTGILNPADIDKIVKCAATKRLGRSEYFIKAGGVCSEIAFVASGILRSFYVSDAGEEMTYCLSFPNSFMTAYSSYILNAPGIENIQAMADTELLILSRQDIEQLSADNMNILRFLKMMAEQEFISLEKRIFQMQKEKARQRYLNLLKEHPNYVQSIPLRYLASYLGITERHLSRIRKEIVL